MWNIRGFKQAGLITLGMRCVCLLGALPAPNTNLAVGSTSWKTQPASFFSIRYTGLLVGLLISGPWWSGFKTPRGLSCEFYVKKCYSHSSSMLQMTSLFHIFLGVFIEICLFGMPSCHQLSPTVCPLQVLPPQVLTFPLQDNIFFLNIHLVIEMLTLMGVTLIKGRLYKLVLSYARTIR
jgi:hypothetical protein